MECFSSFQFSHSVMSDSLRPHESQHTRPPCPSPSPGVHANSRPSSQWCHPYQISLKIDCVHQTDPLLSLTSHVFIMKLITLLNVFFFSWCYNYFYILFVFFEILHVWFYALKKIVLRRVCQKGFIIQKQVNYWPEMYYCIFCYLNVID